MCFICILLPGITLGSIFVSTSVLYNNKNVNNIDNKIVYWI